MKKVFTILISLALIASVAIAPVYAGGGQNHGDEGTWEVVQGDNGPEDASPGDNAEGNQAP